MAGGGRRTLRAWPRAACVGLVSGSALVLTAINSAGTSGAQTGGFNKGTGSAIAESIRLNPVAGGLSFGIGIGEALAAHQNTLGTAESRAANLGVIGTTLAAQGCDGGGPTLAKKDQPQPLRIDSNDEGAAEGRTDEDPKVPGVQRHVAATTDPFARAVTQARGLDIPGVLTIGPTIATTTSGVVGGELREAVATTEIASISVGGGAILVNGLRWEAIHRTGSEDLQSGTFSIASASIAGTPIPTQDPIAALTQLNAVLRPIGVEFRPPTHHVDQTSRGSLSTVDSLGVALVPAPTRDSVLGPVLGGIQPARKALFDALIEADCGNASYITILDIVLAATGAGGEFGIELGGVQATTSELALYSGLGQLPPLPPLSAARPATDGSLRSGVTGGVPTGTPPASVGAPPVTGPPAAAASAATELEAVDAAALGERFGPMFGVGTAGLAALMAAADADRRKMRRAQRQIPAEA